MAQEISQRQADVLQALSSVEQPASAADVGIAYDAGDSDSRGIAQTLRRLRDRGFAVSTDDGWKITRAGAGALRRIDSGKLAVA